MKLEKFLIAVLLVGSACAKVKDDDKVKVEVIREFYPDGKLKLETETRDSVRWGRATEYYENGSVKAKYNFVKGEVDGIYRLFYPDGQVMGVENISKGLLHGDFIYYYWSGNKKASGKYYKGDRVGMHYEYFDNSSELVKIKKEYVLVDHKNLLNYQIQYDSLGEIVKQDSFVNISKEDGDVLIEMVGGNFKDFAVVIGSYNRFFVNSGKLDTIFSADHRTIKIPYTGDTIRGIAIDYEWMGKNKTIARDVYFSYPRLW